MNHTIKDGIFECEDHIIPIKNISSCSKGFTILGYFFFYSHLAAFLACVGASIISKDVPWWTPFPFAIAIFLCLVFYLILFQCSMLKIRTERATFKFNSWPWKIDRMKDDLHAALKSYLQQAEQGAAGQPLGFPSASDVLTTSNLNPASNVRRHPSGASA